MTNIHQTTKITGACQNSIRTVMTTYRLWKILCVTLKLLEKSLSVRLALNEATHWISAKKTKHCIALFVEHPMQLTEGRVRGAGGREGSQALRRVVLAVTSPHWREADTLTKAAGAAAVRCPGTCTGAARQRVVLNRSDEDMWGVTVRSCI